MDFLKGTLKNLKPALRTLAKNTQEVILKNSSKISWSLTDSKKTADDDDEPQEKDIIQIDDRLYWIAFPTKENSEKLINILNDISRGKFYIWNLSEHNYNANLFKNNVAEFNFVGYPCPPLSVIFSICKNIMEWLNADRENIAVVHCQNTLGRTALQISCLLTLMKTANNPFEALSIFCARLGKNENSVLNSSQHKYLTYFSNLFNGIKPNPNVLVLEKMILSEVPKINYQKKTIESFVPYIQIFRNSKIVFNDLVQQKKLVGYKQSDLSIRFDINTLLEDDFLIRCRHYHNDSERISAFRIFANTAFVLDDVLRLKLTDIDISADIGVSKEFFIDLVFKKTETESKEISNLVNLKDETKNYELTVWDKAIEQPTGQAAEKDEEFKAEIQHDSHEPSDASTNTSIRSEGEPEKSLKNPEVHILETHESWPKSDENK